MSGILSSILKILREELSNKTTTTHWSDYLLFERLDKIRCERSHCSNTEEFEVKTISFNFGKLLKPGIYQDLSCCSIPNQSSARGARMA
jgi:hypothetical protein